MRRALVLVCCLCCSHMAAAQQVFSQEDLAQAGVMRLADVFRLAYGFVATSVEGYAWDVAALGLAPQQEPAWQLFVNEAPVDIRGLGRANLNMLPVAATEVCEVQVFAQPVLIGGFLAASARMLVCWICMDG